MREVRIADEKSAKKAESLEKEKHISLDRLDAIKLAQRGGTSNPELPEKIHSELIP